MSKHFIHVVFEAGNRHNGGLKEIVVECISPDVAVDFLKVVNAAALQTDQRQPPPGTRMQHAVIKLLNRFAGEIGTGRMVRPGKIILSEKSIK